MYRSQKSFSTAGIGAGLVIMSTLGIAGIAYLSSRRMDKLRRMNQEYADLVGAYMNTAINSKGDVAMAALNKIVVEGNNSVNRGWDVAQTILVFLAQIKMMAKDKNVKREAAVAYDDLAKLIKFNKIAASKRMEAEASRDIAETERWKNIVGTRNRTDVYYH